MKTVGLAEKNKSTVILSPGSPWQLRKYLVPNFQCYVDEDQARQIEILTVIFTQNVMEGLREVLKD